MTVEVIDTCDEGLVEVSLGVLQKWGLGIK